MERKRSFLRELVLLAGITLLAGFLRLYRIDSLPPGDGYDPAVYGLDALDILDGARPIYLPSNFGREALFSYLVALCVAALGVGPQAIYTASAIAGVLTVPAVYYAAREFFAGGEVFLGREAQWRVWKPALRDTEGERRVWKPALWDVEGERRVWKPALRDAEGERRVWKPALRDVEGERRVWKPALRDVEGERRVWKPALWDVEGERRVWKPALWDVEGERRVWKPALRDAEGERRVWKPALRDAEGERRVWKPALRDVEGEPRGGLAGWGGLLAALATTVSYWHQSWSRLGVRAILAPLTIAITMGLLWRGRRTGERWAFLGCGLSLGLSLYTYQVARLLPAIVLLDFGYAAWVRRSFGRRDLLNLALVALAASIVYAPLGLYFLAHPGVSTVRIEQTLAVDLSQGLGAVARTLWGQLTETASALVVRGDDWPKVNPPGVPALNPILSLAFLLGLVGCVVRIRRSKSLSLLTWLALMIVPALLARRGPTTKRAIGMLPAVMIAIAAGCLVPWVAARRWAARRRLPWARGLAVGLAICIGAGSIYSAVRTYQDYFQRWGGDPSLFTFFEAGLSATGQYIARRPPEERVYLSSVSPEHPSVRYNARRRPNVKGYNGRSCLVLADGAAHEVSYVIAPAEDEEGLSRLQRYLPQGWVAEEGPLHYGLPYFYAYRVPAGARALVAPARVQEVNWDDQIALRGYDLEQERVQPGETVRLTVYYGASSESEADHPGGDYTFFVHLLGPFNAATGGPLWAQDDSEPCRRSYPTSAWGRHEVVVDRYAVTVPPDAPAGDYQIAVGFYEWRTLQRLPVLDGAGGRAGDHVILAEMRVERGE